MTATMTNGAILNRYQLDTDGIEHLDLPCPVKTGAQAQGDVMILPVVARDERGDAIPASGIVVVRGESTGDNAHILHVLDGECFWTPNPAAASELTQGWLTVPEGSSATLIHTQEHSVIAVGCGTYDLRAQREMAGEWRRVAD